LAKAWGAAADAVDASLAPKKPWGFDVGFSSICIAFSVVNVGSKFWLAAALRGLG
jgi:hypothetical protein